MTLSVADTFFASARQLPASDRARVFDFLGKFADNPGQPGLSLERVNARDQHMWSARVTQSLRAILHRRGELNILLYAGRHDDAYRWAERRRLEHHPKTGVLQVVEAPEEVEAAIAAAPSPPSMTPLFAQFDDAYLLSLGVPEDWLTVLRQIRAEEQLLDVAMKLPQEVSERLLTLASGELVTPPVPVRPDQPLVENADNLRRFWVVDDASELREALARPIEAWLHFLHTSQRAIVNGNFKGPVKVTGAAGTGKTVVGMHRARHLAGEGRRVLLTSFVTTLCKNIERNLRILCNEAEFELIKVSTVHQQALRLARLIDPGVEPLDSGQIVPLIHRFQPYGGYQFDGEFLLAEWNGVIDPQGIANWDEYRETSRSGRAKPLSVRQRRECWNVLGRVKEELDRSRRLTWSRICRLARESLDSGKIARPFDAVIVDEVQDLGPQEIRLSAAMAPSGADLMLLGDTGQRIYPGGFSLRSLGIDVRGRSHVLRLNYRTTDQIRRFADKLLPAATDDLDEATESRRSRSLLNGPIPTIHSFNDAPSHERFIVDEIRRLLTDGILPREIAVFGRTASVFTPVRDALERAQIVTSLLTDDADDETIADGVHFGSMHRAKGLEFKVVFAANCSQNVLPHAPTVNKLKDAADHEAALARERQLLYVTLTRARDLAYITCVGKPSRFLDIFADR